MRLLGYVRVSTDDQAQSGHSLALAQPQALDAAMRAQGHVLVDVIVDGEGEGAGFRGVSGGLPLARRKGGAELIRRLRAGEADGVVAYSLERMFRDLDDGRAFFHQYAIKQGLEVITVTEGRLDPSTVSGWMLINQVLLFGELERLRTAERTRWMVQGLRERGRVYGHVPYGCKSVDGALFRDPTTWLVRCQIVELKREKQMSLRAIADVLRKNRVHAPNGGLRWPKSTLAELVKTHESLAHLPMLAGQCATPVAAMPEAAASEETPHVTH